jgi:hypothetical protein
MKNVLVPMAAALAIVAAATAALIAGNAQAETPPKPVMMAMQTSPALLHAVTAGAAGEDAGPRHLRLPPDAQERAARHKQMCQDQFAHAAGEVAYLGARLSLTAAQEPLFERWKTAKLDIARRGAADCATREIPARDAAARPSLLDGMARESDMLKRRLAELEAERPALTAFYNSLTATQKDAMAQPGTRMAIGHMGGPVPMGGSGPMRGPGGPPL